MNHALAPLYRWFMSNPERYATYLTRTEWLSDLHYDARCDFIMFVWHSEGCPEI